MHFSTCHSGKFSPVFLQPKLLKEAGPYCLYSPREELIGTTQPAQSQQVLKLTWKICTQPARFSGFEWEGEMRFIAFFGGKIKTPPNFWFFNWEVLWKEILYRNLKTTGLDFRHTDTRIQQTWDINHLLTFHIPNKHAHKPHMRKNTNFCMTPEIIFRYLFVRLHLAYMCCSFPQP